MAVSNLDICVNLAEKLLQNNGIKIKPINSVITGNRNWFIKVDWKEKTILCGRPGHQPHFVFTCFVYECAQYDWYYYTKKKDFDEAIQKMRELNYQIYFS